MSIFLVKSLLSFLLLLLAGIATVVMLELFGLIERKSAPEKLKAIHKWAGLAFISVFLLITLLCLTYVSATATELNPRGALHAFLGFLMLGLLILKLAFVKRYRHFYDQAKLLGLALAVCSLIITGLTGGYYLLVTSFGGSEAFYGSRLFFGEQRGVTDAGLTKEPSVAAGNAKRGKEIFDEKCIMCHDTQSNRTVIGPGLKGIFLKQAMPVSKKAVTPEQIRDQIRHPFDKMPPFPALSDADIADIIAYLKTL